MKPFRLLAICAFLLVGCETPRAPRLRADSPEVIEQARLRVLDQLPVPDSESREMVRTNAPRINYVGIVFGDTYLYSWTISSNRTAVLDSFSNLKNSSNRPVWIHGPAPTLRY